MVWNSKQVHRLLELGAAKWSAMQKGVTTTVIAPVVPQDLEVESHNTLWSETTPTELTLLKLIPSVEAKQIAHQYTRVTNFGDPRGSGFFGETSLPPNTSVETELITNNIRLLGEIGSTFLLAELEKTLRVLGTTGASNIERRALRLNTLRKKNRNLYRSDTRVIRQGINGVRFKGLLQLIEEGTDGTTGTSPFGSHVIDMQGQSLNVETLREKGAEALTQFGFPTCLLMDPFVRSDFEASLDTAQRLPLPINMRPYLVGQQVYGLQTQGNVMRFLTDNTLTPRWYGGKYVAAAQEGGPTTRPTVTASAGAAGGSTSYWDSNQEGAGDVHYLVTEMRDELEGLGTRYPAASELTVTAGQKVTILITPGNPQADSFRVYRGKDTDTADTDAYFAFEVANPGTSGAVVTAYDLNANRPGLGTAFALAITSMAQQALTAGLATAYDDAVTKSASFFKMPDDEVRNTVACAELGPSMGILALASIIAEIDRPLMYSACAPQVRNPFQNFAFKNIGRA